MPNPVEVKGIVTTATMPLRTYRADLTVVGAAGNVVEISLGPRSEGTKVRITRLFFSKPSAAVVLTMRVQVGVDTGGTSTNATVVGINNDVQSKVQIKLYTVAPTLGLLLASIWSASVATGDVFSEEFAGGGLLLDQGRPSFALNIDAIATIRGSLEWTEEAK